MYDAFVSYSHVRDKPIAQALQIAVQTLGKPWWKRRSLRVFRDDTSLSATPGLWPSIELALSKSRYFILLASPDAAASPWVSKEAAYWCAHKDAQKILIALTDGVLAWNPTASDFQWDEATPLPATLRGIFRSEPKWIDLRRYRDQETPTARTQDFVARAADFAATLHGIPKEDVFSEELVQQRKALTLAWAAASGLLLLVVATVWQAWQATSARNAAEEKQRQALVNESRLLAGLADQQAESGDYVTATLIAMEGLPDAVSGMQRPTVFETERSIQRAFLNVRELAIFRHRGTVRSSVFSPDRMRVLSVANEDDTQSVRVWDVREKREIRRFTPDGKVLATAYGDDGPRALIGRAGANEAAIWDVLSASAMVGLTIPIGDSDDVKFSPDGLRIVSLSRNAQVRVFSARNAAELKTFKHSPADVRPADAQTFNTNHDGSALIIGGWFGGAWVYDLRTGTQTGEMGAGGRAVLAALSPNGSTAITTSMQNEWTAHVWDVASGREVATLDGHTGSIGNVSFNADGSRAVTSSEDGTARIWDTKTGDLVVVLRGHREGEGNATFSLDGTSVLTTSGDGTMKLWGISGQGRPTVIRAATTPLAFSFDGLKIATGSREARNVLQVWEIETGHKLLTLVGHEAEVTSAAFSPDNSRIVTGSDDRAAHIWDAATGKNVTRLRGHAAAIKHVSFSNDGQRVATSSEDGTARVWNAITGEEVGVLRQTGKLLATHFVGTQARAVVVTPEKRTNVVDILSGNVISMLAPRDSLLEMSTAHFSTSAPFIITIDFEAHIWDSRTGLEKSVLKSQGIRSLNCAALSPDGARAITGYSVSVGRQKDPLIGKELLVLWDVLRQAPLISLEGSRHGVYGVAFSADGARIGATDSDDVRIWRVFPTTQSLVEKARAILPRCLTTAERARYLLARDPPEGV